MVMGAASEDLSCAAAERRLTGSVVQRDHASTRRVKLSQWLADIPSARCRQRDELTLHQLRACLGVAARQRGIDIVNAAHYENMSVFGLC